MDAPKKCSLIPPDEQRCVWMEAGVLFYRLCDRRQDCDNCSLDAAMHRRVAVTAESTSDGSPGASDAGSQDTLLEGLRYNRGHWWALRLREHLFRLGIEPGLADALSDIKGVVLPSPRQRLRKGQACIWVVLDGGTLPLEAPLDGVVLAVNPDLIAKPFLLCQEPFQDGWLCDLEADDEAVATAGLMSANEARMKYAIDQSRFTASLAAAPGSRRHRVGITLADGGQRLRNIADILGPNRYLALVRRLCSYKK
jgi:glycine cleavage system H protein